mgnify:CR=1 FL=1
MELIRTFIRRGRRWLRALFDAEYREKRRLQQKERYRPGCTSLLEAPTRFVDAASFLSAYEAIFEDEIYQFEPEVSSPYIIDGGANIGLATLYWKNKIPEARVTAFEPDPQIFRVLEWNVQNHDHEDVTLIRKGLWSEKTTLKFKPDGADAGHVPQKDSANTTGHEVPVTQLVPYLNERVDLLKLDIEGAEVDVLLDAAGHLRTVQNLFVEYHSYVGEEQRIDEVLRVLRSAGFRIHIQPELVADQPFVQRFESYGMDHRLNIFAYRE